MWRADAPPDQPNEQDELTPDEKLGKSEAHPLFSSEDP
jgi:hypothetical protein